MIVEGGVVSLGAEERGEECVPVVTQKVTEKIVVRLGTRSLERRAPNSGCDGGTKPAQVDVSITKLLSIMLHCHWVYGGLLTKIGLLN